MARREVKRLGLAFLLLACTRTSTNAEFAKRELARMVKEDQDARLHNRPWAEIDRRNTAELKRLLAVHGWFTRDRFGKQADDDAWLLAQHADHDPAFQAEILARLEALAQTGQTDPKHVAYLYDRVHSAQDGGLQRYGTQGQCTGMGRWEPFPLEDAARVDQLRAAVGLEPLADYQKRFAEICR